MTYEAVLPLYPGLLRRASARPEKKPRGTSATIPAAVVLEIRRRHELESWPMKCLFAAYPNLSELYIRRVLAYELRANLRVRPLR